MSLITIFLCQMQSWPLLRCTPWQRHLVAKSDTTLGQVDMWWDPGVRVSLTFKCEPIRLWVSQIVGGENWWPNHIEPQSRVPALPLVPLVEWPIWPRLGKRHKWTPQHFIYLWHYFWGWFAVLYLYDLITFLHQVYRNATRTICSPGQFTHILPPSIWCITTPRYYFLGHVYWRASLVPAARVIPAQLAYIKVVAGKNLVGLPYERPFTCKGN